MQVCVWLARLGKACLHGCCRSAAVLPSSQFTRQRCIDACAARARPWHGLWLANFPCAAGNEDTACPQHRSLLRNLAGLSLDAAPTLDRATLDPQALQGRPQAANSAGKLTDAATKTYSPPHPSHDNGSAAPSLPLADADTFAASAAAAPPQAGDAPDNDAPPQAAAAFLGLCAADAAEGQAVQDDTAGPSGAQLCRPHCVSFSSCTQGNCNVRLHSVVAAVV